MNRKQKRAAPSIYFDMSTGEFIQSSGIHPLLHQQGQLKRVPAGLVLVAGPLISLAYIIFLPFTGIMAAFAGFGIKLSKVRMALRRRAQEHSSIISK